MFQYMREYIAESPKQGSKRFNSFVKTIGFDHLVIIYLWVIHSMKKIFTYLPVPDLALIRAFSFWHWCATEGSCMKF